MRRKELAEEQWRKVALLPPQELEVIARLGTTGILDGLGRCGGGVCLVAYHADRTVENTAPMKGTLER